jgi:hypothetical protein
MELLKAASQPNTNMMIMMVMKEDYGQLQTLKNALSPFSKLIDNSYVSDVVNNIILFSKLEARAQLPYPNEGFFCLEQQGLVLSHQERGSFRIRGMLFSVLNI